MKLLRNFEITNVYPIFFMYRFLYDRDFRHQRVKDSSALTIKPFKPWAVPTF